MSTPVLKNLLQPRPVTSKESIARQPIGGDESDLMDTLAVVVEHTPVAIAMFDRQMRYVLANKQWVQEFNLSQSLPLVGKSQYDVFPTLHPGWRQLYERALQGYTMRTDHPLQSSAGGPAVVFRCEVRPWRQKRDASVAGVVVTCTKFNSAAAPAPESKVDWAATELPMFQLDAAGRILAANPRAVELSLARGLEEGVTSLWEVMAEEADRPALKKTFDDCVERLRNSPALPPQILTLKTRPAPPPESDGHGSEPPPLQPPCRWMLARHGEDGSRFSLVGLTGLSPFEAVTKVGIQLPATPNSSAPRDDGRANRSALPAPNANHERELAALREQLHRLQLELRTLREAEKTIARREAQRQSILDALPGGILVLDEHGRPQWHNSRLRQLFGRGIDADLTIEDWLGLFCPEDEHRAEVRRIWREDIWRRQLTRTLSLVTRDGLLREIELRPASLAQDGLLVHFQDVSAPCRLEEQMSALESKFRVLFQDNPLPVVSADKAGSIYDVNRAAQELFQRPKAELRRMPVDALLSAEGAAARHDALREMRQSGALSRRLTVRLAGEDGPRMHLTLAAVPAADGEIHSTLHFFETPLSWNTPPAARLMDQPEAEPAEPGISESNENAGSVVETPEPAPVLLLATAANGRIQTWTEQAEAVFGYTAAEAADKPLHLLFQPSDASGFYGVTLPQAVRQQQVEWTFYGRDGRRGTFTGVVRLGGSGGSQVTIWTPLFHGSVS